MVLPANVYDSLVAGSDLLQTDETQLLGTAISAPATAGLHDVNVKQISADATAADNAELMFDGTGYAGGTTKLGVSLVQILGTAITETAGQIAAAFTKFFDKAAPTGTINSIPDAVAGAASGIAIVGSEMAANVTKVNGVAQTATLDTLKTVVDTIQADTDLLDDAIGGRADIHTAVAAVKSDTAAILLDTGTDGVVLPQAQADKVWGTAARILTANTNFNDPTAATIADAVWDEAIAGHAGVGSTGAQLWTDIDAIAVDVAGLDGAAMRGTDSAALASVCTEGRLSELDAATGGKLANVADVIAVDVAGLDGAAMRRTNNG